MNISIFGLGYVGCVGMGCLAGFGHRIIGVDINQAKIDTINRGLSPIIENKLDKVFRKYHKTKKIIATNDVTHAIKNTDISFICVGTPSSNEGHLNLDAILKTAEDIGKALKDKKAFHVIVIRSTVLPGTNRRISEIIANEGGKLIEEDFAVVSNPEFLREGTAVDDFINPPYTLVGTHNNRAKKIMTSLYHDINAPIIFTDIKIAEMIKYVNNAFHALKVTFANEIGNICGKLDVNSHELMRIFCLDTKLNLSPYYLKPGFAYGGSCLPKDLKALQTISHDNYLRTPVLESIETSNNYHKDKVLEDIISFQKQKIGILGISFKEGTDDLRSSPIIDILEKLLGKGYEVKIYDKNISLSRLIGKNKEYINQRIPYISRFILSNPLEVIKGSDLIVVVNKDEELLKNMEKLTEDKIVYDLVNIRGHLGKNKVNYKGLSW